MMTFLNDQQKRKVVDQIGGNIGYRPEIRQIMWNDINRQFRDMQPANSPDLLQLILDVNVLNRTPRLTDGIIPFESWLQKAAWLLKPYPDALAVIQTALNTISLQQSAQQIVNQVPPSPELLQKAQLEKTIHRDDMVSFAFLESGYNAGIAVARIKVTRYEGHQARMSSGKPALYLGTGWLLTKELLITNHHVIRARENNEPGPTATEFEHQAKSAVAEFDFNSESVSGTDVNLSELVAADKDLDYAVFRLTLQDSRKPLCLSSEKITIDPAAVEVVNIIQHPLGHAKKVAIRNNHIYDTPYPSVRYFTDTEGGSSGSPVFNDNWEVIALHRAYNLVDNVSYMGQHTAWINEGVQMHAIKDHLENNYPAVWSDIANG